MKLQFNNAILMTIITSAILLGGCGDDAVVPAVSSGNNDTEKEQQKPDKPGTSETPDNPGGQVDPGTDPVDPGTDPVDPGTDPVDPGTDPVDPGTDPVDPGTDPVEPGTDDNICEVGAVRCFDGYIHICSGKVWNDGEDCEFDCRTDETGCNKCESGSVKCENSQIFHCSDGNWTGGETCAKGCKSTEPACNVCTPGEQKCENNAASVCVDGAWNTQKCNYGCNGNICAEINNNQPTRYITSASNPYSPITPYVLNRMKQIAAKNTSARNSVFMKVGDSHYNKSFDGKFMLCFSNATSAQVTLDSHTEVQDVITQFQSSFDSFNRDSVAAVGGTATNYLFYSSKSYPLQSEINAINPRFAFFDHGTNDMGNGSYTHNEMTYTYNGAQATAPGYSWSIQDYYRQVTKAMNMMENAGIIPMITNIIPRHDTPTNINYLGNTPIPSTSDYPTHMVSAFNAVSRGVAEARQIPFFDANAVFKTLPNEGISSDKLHASSSGSPCRFTSEGLQYGVNARNLGSITMLHNAWNALYNNNGGKDNITEAFEGSGSQSDPFVITSLPYSHSADTSKSTNTNISVYSGCAEYKENGPEYYYKLVLSSTKRLRMFALSSTSSIDVDIHLLRSNMTAAACIKRSDVMIQGTLKAGTYYIAVDSYGSDSSNAGEYLLGVVECDSDDKYCDTAL